MAAAVTRMREMGVRIALGATRGRLVRQVVTESLLLGLMAGGLGLLLATWIGPIFAAMVELSPDIDVAPNSRVLLFTVAVALTCGLCAGLAPARHGARGNVLLALQSQSGSRGVVPARLRTTFVGFQAAVSMLMLVCAALLARTAILTTRADIGFDADRLLAVSLEPLRAGLNQATYVQNAIAAVREVPSVEGVSVTQYPPFGGFNNYGRFTHGDRSYDLAINRADARYFATAGVRVLHGRAFTDEEVTRDAPVALIGDSVARAIFQGNDPLGQALSVVPTRRDQRQEVITIIGVVADAMLRRPDSRSSGEMYRPLSQQSGVRFTDQGFPYPPSLIVRTATLGITARAVEDALRRIDPGVRPRTSNVRDRLDSYFSSTRMIAWLSGPPALLALILAALGIYGVTAFVVSLRTGEVSVRMAMGASGADVWRLLVRDSLRPVIIGLTVGLFVALAVGRVFSRMLWGISPHDPLAIGVAATTLMAAGITAVIIPARRAARTDPANLLRQV
jgi:predicted permease